MNQCHKTALGCVVALGSAAVFLLMQQYGPLGVACGLILAGMYVLLVVISLMVRGCNRSCRASQDPESQEEDLPPSYETVAAKPPPYYLLFANADPTDDLTPRAMPSMDYVPVHLVLHNGCGSDVEAVNGRPSEADGASPPSYSDAMSNNNTSHCTALAIENGAPDPTLTHSSTASHPATDPTSTPLALPPTAPSCCATASTSAVPPSNAVPPPSSPPEGAAPSSLVSLTPVPHELPGSHSDAALPPESRLQRIMGPVIRPVTRLLSWKSTLLPT